MIGENSSTAKGVAGREDTPSRGNYRWTGAGAFASKIMKNSFAFLRVFRG
jgi:hypothetical protein